MSGAGAVAAGTVHLSLRRQRIDLAGYVFSAILLLSLLFSLAVLTVLVADQLIRGLPVFTERGTSVLTSPLSSNPARAGVIQGLIGSALLAVIVALTAFPIGILTAVYVEEYAPANRLTRFIDINIRNLAGVPSIVYGILGFAIFVKALGSLTGGRSVIAAGRTSLRTTCEREAPMP